MNPKPTETGKQCEAHTEQEDKKMHVGAVQFDDNQDWYMVVNKGPLQGIVKIREAVNIPCGAIEQFRLQLNKIVDKIPSIDQKNIGINDIRSQIDNTFLDIMGGRWGGLLDMDLKIDSQHKTAEPDHRPRLHPDN